MYKLELKQSVSPQDAPRIAARIAQAINKDPASVQRLLLKGGRIARMEDAQRAQRLLQVFQSAGAPVSMVAMSRQEIESLQGGAAAGQRGGRASQAHGQRSQGSTGIASALSQSLLGIFAFLSVLFTGVLAFLRWGNPLAFGTWLERLSAIAFLLFALATLLLLIALIVNRKGSARGLWRTGSSFALLGFAALAATMVLPQLPFDWAKPHASNAFSANTAAISTPAASTTDSTTTTTIDTTLANEPAEADFENLPLVPTLASDVVTVESLEAFFSAEPYNYQSLADWDDGAMVDFHCIETADINLTDRDSICYQTLNNRQQIVRIFATSNRTGTSLTEPSAITGLAAFFGATEDARVRNEIPSLTFGQEGTTVKVGEADAKLTGGASNSGNNLTSYEVSAGGWNQWIEWYRFYTGRNPRPLPDAN